MSAPNRSTLSQTTQTHAAGDDRINAAAVDARAGAGRPSYIAAAKHEKQGGVRCSVKDKPASDQLQRSTSYAG